MTGARRVAIRAGAPSGPVERLHRAPEPGQDLLRELVRAHRGATSAGSQRNAVRIASGQRQGRASSSGGTSGVRRIARRPSSSRISPDSEPANDGPSRSSGGSGRRAGGRADLAEAHDALVVGHPEHGQPPVVGAVHGLGHAGLEAAVADADLLLAQERGAGMREAFGHRARGYRRRPDQAPALPAPAQAWSPAVRPGGPAGPGLRRLRRPSARRRRSRRLGVGSAIGLVGSAREHVDPAAAPARRT